MKGLGGFVVMAMVVALAGCSTDISDSTAPVYLRVMSVEGAPGGDATATYSPWLHSDVLWEDPTGQKGSSIFPDMAKLTVAAIPKNPDYLLWAGQLRTTSLMQDVRLERYEVVYTRTDGRNVAGVDVPQAISGPMATVVPFDGTAEAVIEVVRHAAKEEPPLRNLRFGGGEEIFTCIATITVHGRTGAGEVVVGEGMLQITFTNFGN
jgi:hypothetical protein